MSKTCLLAVLCALDLAVATPAFAKTSRTKVVTIAGAHQAASPAASCRIICRQDLFDRNNRNNVRSGWPGPPAQPAQF
jgi:hypothetical protein